VAGLDEAANRTLALELAKAQQAHRSDTGPRPAADSDDLEVPLDRPNLGVPVYWLGREFAPGGSLPPLTLRDAWGPIEPGGGPGWRVELEYAGPEGAQPIKLGIWQAASWTEFLATALGRAVWDSPCARATEIALPDGRAVIYAGYRDEASCSTRAPDRYVAHVYFADAVVSVQAPYWLMWASSELALAAKGLPDPYNSPAGMEAIVRGLRRR
jgi:hypothetical protein